MRRCSPTASPGAACRSNGSAPSRSFRRRCRQEAFRLDLFVEGKLLIELKSVERLAPVHGKQVLTYLRLMNLPLGLLMNFGAATFREGVKRVVN